MELEILPGLVVGDGDVVVIVLLLLHVIINFFGDFWFVRDLYMQSLNPLGGTIEVLTQFVQFLSIQTFNRHFVVDLVHKSIVHDVLDPLFFGDLSKFVSTGGIGVLFSGDGEK